MSDKKQVSLLTFLKSIDDSLLSSNVDLEVVGIKVTGSERIRLDFKNEDFSTYIETKPANLFKKLVVGLDEPID